MKAFVLIATLGMNLGYICGFALNSFVISLIFVLFILSIRFISHENQLKYYLILWLNDLKKNPIFYSILAIPSFILLFLFLPLVLQIYSEAKLFQLTEGTAPHFWSHPFRLLLPYFPSFSALFNPFTFFFRDMPEGLGSYSPGWLCMSLGVLGFLKNRKEYWKVFLPLLIILFISLIYHPNKIPTLKIFPWGVYNRVTSRFTSILPVIACCFFLPLNFSKISYKKIFILSFTTILLLEVSVVYGYLFSKKTYEFDKNFFSYMKNIQAQKGEAIMDFPFCIVGGDGKGLKENLCPIFKKTCNVYALSRFHHKKVIGGYYSHVPDNALNGFVNAGIGNWVFPDTKDWQNAQKITNEFTEEQLKHFIKYFQYNDFVGINVNVDLISDRMYQQIINEVGKPTHETVFPGAGKTVFIPKPPKWKNLVNSEKAQRIHFPCGCN